MGVCTIGVMKKFSDSDVLICCDREEFSVFCGVSLVLFCLSCMHYNKTLKVSPVAATQMIFNYTSHLRLKIKKNDQF